MLYLKLYAIIKDNNYHMIYATHPQIILKYICSINNAVSSLSVYIDIKIKLF